MMFYIESIMNSFLGIRWLSNEYSYGGFFNEDFMLLIELVFRYIFRYSGSDKKNKYQRVDETI